MRIAVIGGGPAGLFFARLMKRQDPSHEIRIVEQNPADATYGFGVTLAGSARDRLRQADPDVHDRLASRMVYNSEQAIILNGRSITLDYAASGGAIARLSLLQTLEELGTDVGLTVEHDTRLDAIGDLSDYDLVVGADGANSSVRASRPEAFATSGRGLGNRFAWFGVAKALKPNALSFKRVGDGCFVAHYYAYSDSMSTFVAEVDEETWLRTGFGEMTDAERKAEIERIFADELEGETLVENKSIWRNFNAVRAERWTDRNVVLIGDALRVAHFSIGSGTRLAMDDALALATALRGTSDAPAALERFVQARRPTRDLFSDAMGRSYEWYEDVRKAMQASDVVDFAYGFLTRTGRIDEERLRTYVPGFHAVYTGRRQPQVAHAAS